jgi:hypothetical protein
LKQEDHLRSGVQGKEGEEGEGRGGGRRKRKRKKLYILKGKTIFILQMI